jgi:hypothetical protein
MTAKFSFRLRSDDWRRAMTGKIILVQHKLETPADVLRRMFGYLLLYRERMLIETTLPDDNIVYVPDLAQLDYQLRPVLWVECGECPLDKLNRLAVKAPEAEIWIIRQSAEEAHALMETMIHHQLRKGRYHIVGLDQTMFEEVLGLLKPRNDIFWLAGDFEPPTMQFDFNGLWFDATFTLLRF